MEFDVLLPALVFSLTTVTVLLYQRFKGRFTSIFGEKKITVRDAVLMVAFMGLMVTAVVFIPKLAVQIIFVAAYSYVMFSFTYVLLKRWYAAAILPIVFILSYTFYWKLWVFNIFVAVFAVMIPLYIGALFSWKTTWVFAAVLTVMDVIQVFGTGFMGESAVKMIELKLPVALLIPTFPAGRMIGLGLGDIFLAGLLAVQTALKENRKAGILTAAAIASALFIFEVALFNVAYFRFFPATVVVIAGWLAGIGVTRATTRLHENG